LVSLRLFEHTLIPGLLQTEGYARAVLETHPNTGADEVEKRLAARMARQAVLERDDPPPPILWVLLDENVLVREVGSARVIRDQLAHLAGQPTNGQDRAAPFRVWYRPRTCQPVGPRLLP
jgi:hypothetical protein